MLHFAPWKAIAIVLVCLAAIVISIPNFFTKEQVERWPSWVPKKQFSLGLDLRGGAHLLLSMDSSEVRKDWLEGLRDDARRRMRDARIGVAGLGITQNGIRIQVAKTEEAEKALRELRNMAQTTGSAILGTETADLEVRKGDAAGSILIVPTERGIQQRITNAIGAAIETVRRRVDAMGTTEPNIVRQGADRILVQVPGLRDTKQLKELIGKTARLSFHDVHPSMGADEARQSRVPIGYKVYASLERVGESMLLKEAAVVRGDELVDSQPGFDQRTNEPIISFRFNNSGARKFGNFTKDNVGRPFAIVLDDQVISAPVIREPILGGTGQISGNFSVETANQLAIQLRSGALPAKLTIVEERTVGPSLGADSISAGTRAAIIGAVASIALMIYMYGTFGMFAAFGLLLNGFMITAVMSLFGTTLTLPGIAGAVLTLGMAVDANVLIYERIREELANGKTAIAAIDAGFSRAMVTILDSQLTTLAAAIIMFWLGSGPIRGFAVTLSIGIFTSIFTAVTVVRLIVAYWVKSQRSKRTSMEVPV